MRAKVFVNMHYMALGGAERALLGLLNALDPERVQVDLFLNQHTGEFMPLIPGHVRLLPEMRGYNAIERPMCDIIGEGQWRIAAARLWARWLHRRYRRTLTPAERRMDISHFQYVARCVTPILPPIMAHADCADRAKTISRRLRRLLGFDGHADSADWAEKSININNLPNPQNLREKENLREEEYDLAISFLTPHNIVLDKVRARKKVAWIHTDYSTVHVNVEQELPVWSGYDHIASISEDCTRSFLQKFPSLENKIILIENILSPTLVRRQADAFDVSAEMPIGGG